MLEQAQLTHVIVVILSHKHIHVHLEPCLALLVFKLYLRIGNALLDIVYLGHHVSVEQILNHILVQVVEI